MFGVNVRSVYTNCHEYTAPQGVVPRSDVVASIVRTPSGKSRGSRKGEAAAKGSVRTVGVVR